LTRPLDRHLDSDELDALVLSQAPGVSVARRLSEEVFREVQLHVESCQDCDRKVQMHRSAQNAISLRVMTGQAAKGSNCSEESEWVRVAAGLLENTEAKERMKHATQCGYCGPLLKAAVRSLSEETTPDEEAALGSLTSAGRDWQAQMAQKLRKISAPGPELGFLPRFRKIIWSRPAFATAALAVLAVAAWIAPRIMHRATPDELLARAYTERRTIEIRIPGAKYAPLRVERSGITSNFDRPDSLLKAESLISELLRSKPHDPDVLGAKARADLLDGSYDDAIKTLQRALESKPDSPELLADLGSAYFLRAKSTDRPMDYGLAIDSLGKALATNPDDPIALFNQALACEQILAYEQAVKDWERYLEIDPQGDWSEEARGRLAGVREKLEHQRKGQSQLLLSPDQIAVGGAPDDVALEDGIEERVEQYLHVAITNWLPQAFPPDSSQSSPNARAALFELSKVARRMHGDRWLSELLAGPKSKEFSAGVEALAASVRSNDKGDYAGGQRLAHQAVLLFDAAANPAGRIRSQAEEVYSDHLLWEGSRCLALLRRMAPSLSESSYTWIQAQLSLEQSNCANAVGDLGTYQSAIGTGLRLAREHNYLALYLRALGFQALSYGSAGELDTTFSLTAEGLTLFWSHRIDLMKGYNLYFNLESVVEERHLPYLQVVLLQEATALIDGHPDVLQRAMAHRWYGNAAYTAKMPQLAASEFAKASALFAACPRTVATMRDYMDAEVWRAHAEIAAGDLQRATERLEAIQSTVESAPSFDPEIGLYAARADIAMRRKDSADAESAIRSAVFLAEWALTSYPSEDGRRQWAEETRTTYREAVEWRLRQGDSTSALELWEWYRGAEFRGSGSAESKRSGEIGVATPPDPHNPPPLPTPAVVASQLPLMHDVTVVAYAVFSDGVAIWSYDDRGIFSHWVSTSLPQTEELVLRFERLCSDPSSDLATLRMTAHSLYNLLVAPVVNQLQPNRTILFEPDDAFAAVPWDALVDGDWHYLAQSHAIVVTPALYRAIRTRPAMPITSDTGALIVSVPSAENLMPLSDADNEAQSVSSKFARSHWLQGRDATVAEIRREVRGMAVFHFAGHAIASPLRSGLLLAEIDPKLGRSRLITAESFAPREISSLQLAVLSACHTSGEAQFGRVGTESLVDALLRSGVPHVVASLWDVDSRETAEFMKEFYSHLLEGNDAAHAILAARKDLASHPASAHPYYWSAFELEGKA